MANKKLDGIVEAVHYARNGQIDFVRAYERRGVTFSDRVLLDRKTLLERLKAKKRFATGRRKELWAGTFDPGRDLLLVERDGKEYVSTRADASRDELDAPVI
ncbi:MAG: hypothetical protein AB1750_11315 [Chloroflexota bacterium]